MYIVYERSGVMYAKNLDTVSKFSAYQDQISDYGLSDTFFEGDTEEATVARFNDIIEAMADGQAAYDLRNEVGYWKPKKTGPKPKAPAKAKEPASREHHEPAPKK